MVRKTKQNKRMRFYLNPLYCKVLGKINKRKGFIESKETIVVCKVTNSRIFIWWQESRLFGGKQTQERYNLRRKYGDF